MNYFIKIEKVVEIYSLGTLFLMLTKKLIKSILTYRR